LVCSCGNGTSFKVDEITGISTCEDYLNPCSNTDPVEFTGDFTCSVNTKYADTANCYTYENCERSVTLSSGLEAVQQVQKQVNCYDAGNGTVQCSCYDPTSNKSVNQYLSDISMSKACGVMEDVCWNGVEPAPQGEVTCESVPGNSYHDENQCQEQQNCTQEATIGDQTTSLVDTTYVYCAIDTGDAMICSCQDFNGATATIDATASGDNAGLCTGLIGSCPDILAAPVSGDVSCAVTNQGSSGNYNCSADVSCEQAGQLGDIQFTKSGYLSVSCGRTGDDTSDWSCGCYSSGVNGNATITMPGDVGAWDTCSNAVNECATKVDILIGSNGGGGGVIGKPVNAVEAGAR
jgi:hypothetical protein